MELTVQTDDPALATVAFKIPGSDFQKEFHVGLRRMGSNVRMKGFRPGKMPANVLEKQFGEQVRKELIEHYLRQAYQQAVESEELKPMTNPRVDLEGLKAGEDGSYEITFDIPLKPTFTLPEYKGMSIESELEPVLDDDVQETLADIRRRESVPEPAGEEGIDEDGVIHCDVRFLHGEEVVFERDDLRLAAHAPPPGLDADAFKAALVGAKDDAVLELDMTLPPTVEKEEARGQPGTCRLEVKQAFRMVPPEDDELFGKLEAENLTDLEGKIRKRLEEAAEEREEARIQNALLDRLIRDTKMDLPQSIVEDQTQQRLAQLASQMAERGVPEEQVADQLKDQNQTAREEAERGLKALLVVEAVGEEEKLLVTAEEIQEELQAIADRNGVTPEEVRKYYMENNLSQQMTIEIMERKVRRFVRDAANVSVPS